MQMRWLATGCAVALMSASAVLTGPAAASDPSRNEPFRPQLHYTPAANWMNDPNGLLYYEGEYHLFYQYNPDAATGNGGDKSWGHAVSPDLLHWEDLPIAIPFTDTESIWSGSAVVDHANTSGLGTVDNPPMVAIYTSHGEQPGRGFVQSQSLAYSIDLGRTWKKFAGNPVLDVGSADFRDPKVSWYEDGQFWLMTVARPGERRIEFYRSADLKSWSYLSDFGPANAIGGAWECPDMFELAVDGDPTNTKWVMTVSVSSGAPAGGSGTQYFVGEFDGERFTAENIVTDTQPPAGEVFEDFEGDNYANWTVRNDNVLSQEPFGDRPYPGTIPGQQLVTGYLGEQLVNSHLGGDGPRGQLVSPTFTVSKDYINALVGGGRHPHATEDDPVDIPAATDVLSGVVKSVVVAPSSTEIAMNLVIDGSVVRTATGHNAEMLDWISWNVTEFAGRQAHIEINDFNTGGWGHINVDHIIFSDEPAIPVAPRYGWFDHGPDNYAAISWDDAPDDRRLMIGWMTNLEYAGVVPTSPWRGAMTLPRELQLRTIDGKVTLVQQAVSEMNRLRGDPSYESRNRVLSEGVERLPDHVNGSLLEIQAEFELGTAEEFGFVVRGGEGEGTVIGYDTATQRIFVDRTASGLDDFHYLFPAVHSGPLKPVGNRVAFKVYVDRSSVEVFGGEGQTVLTNLIFPELGSDEVSLYAEGGDVTVRGIAIRPLASVWP